LTEPPNKRMDAVGARPSVAAGLARPGVAPYISQNSPRPAGHARPLGGLTFVVPYPQGEAIHAPSAYPCPRGPRVCQSGHSRSQATASARHLEGRRHGEWPPHSRAELLLALSGCPGTEARMGRFVPRLV